MRPRGKGGLCLAAPAAPAADPAAMRAAAAAKLRAAAAARRAELVRAQRGFNIDGDGLPELLLAAPEPAGFERLAVLRRHVATLEAWGGGFIAFQRQILRNITLVCLPHLFGADFEAARARLCEMFATDVLQAWTFTVAPRRVGKTETTMLALGALVAAGAYLDLLFMHETRDTVMKDIADMVAAAQRCDPALEWRGDRKGVSWLGRKGRAGHAAEKKIGSFTQPNVGRPPRPFPPPIPHVRSVRRAGGPAAAPRLRRAGARRRRRAAAAPAAPVAYARGVVGAVRVRTGRGLHCRHAAAQLRHAAVRGGAARAVRARAARGARLDTRLAINDSIRRANQGPRRGRRRARPRANRTRAGCQTDSTGSTRAWISTWPWCTTHRRVHRAWR